MAIMKLWTLNVGVDFNTYELPTYNLIVFFLVSCFFLFTVW